MQNYFKDKVVIITGSTMGIGKEIAKQLLQFGSKVVITGRNTERIERLKEEWVENFDRIHYFQGDVTNIRENEEMIAQTLFRFKKIDILINNAGLSCFGEVNDLNENVAKEIIDANIYGSLYPVMAAIPALKKSKGSILFISSIAGFQGLPGYSCYSLSKMSLGALAQSLNIELKKSNVFVGITYVGFTENENEKKTISPSGELVDVPKRPKSLTYTREKTASKILRQLKNRKRLNVQSILGKVSYKFNRFFPKFSNRLMSYNYNRMNPTS